MNRSVAALQRGFTLIELMIVVAIIGILAAIALPQYQTYMIKSKLVEATTDLDAAKISVTESFSSNNNNFPATAPFSTSVAGNATYAGLMGYGTSGAGATGTAMITVKLTSTGNGTVDGKFLGLLGQGEADGTVLWSCGTASGQGAGVPAGTTALYPYLPAPCQH